ncbi:MAG: ABC-F family ATP-binding cassette domain-containing protein [Acutalibacteraceae bacterium]|nr:ABC-F family ATP-binding cassette domain-containing protein [Acutalibacteraceae bacterium]
MYFSVLNANVSFSGEDLLTGINFEIKDKERIAVVGRNGCGKTTLLRLLSGELEAEGSNSSVNKSQDMQIGFLRQISFTDLSVTLEDELEKAFERFIKMKEEMDGLLLMAQQGDEEAALRYSNLEEQYKNLGGYYYAKEKETVISKFGFSDQRRKPLKEFSGGQLTKIAFMKLLLSKPDLLLLDEPTNHLDLQTVTWLEGYLKTYPAAIVLVSHDQMFVDRLAHYVYEIEYGKITKYRGNYSEFVKIKRAQQEKQLKEHLLQKKEIEKTQALIERFRYKATKAAMVQSKIKALDKKEIIEAPVHSDTKAFFTDLTPELTSGTNVLEVKNLKIGYDKVLSTVSFLIKRGEKLGVIGANGKGKSTLLKTVMGMQTSLGGSVIQGVNVRIGYFDQHIAQYVSDKTVLDDYWDAFPNLTETQARTELGSFLFSGEDVFKKVSVLSGGEKVRLCLCKILKRKPNFLILDEPTNHMDIVGKEALEQMLKSYQGTILCVSHDRYFIKEVCDNLLVFTEDSATHYHYGYDEYEKQQENEIEAVNAPQKNVAEKSGKYYSAFKELSKVKKKIEKLEKDIAEREENIENLKLQMQTEEISTDFVRLEQIMEEIDGQEQILNEIYSQWEELCVKKEELEADN